VVNALSPAAVAALRREYEAAKPYAHAVIPNLCNPADARAMLAEIQSLSGTLKETDLFKVYQTGDLANADDDDAEHVAKLGTLLRLRRELNSPAFKKVIEDITGCGPLSSTVDLSANVYALGGHLLCHDDVISTRKVSYIVYLSDPDEPWTPQDGGRLELYAGDGLVPDPEPSARVPPAFNTMALFVVQPGVSFHSVEEVRVPNKPRVSLQGWFHAATAPEGAAEKASLQQLLATHSPAPFAPLPEGVHCALSAADVAELREWVNPTFLTSAAMKQICERCETADACVSLVKFLRPDVSARLQAAMRASETGAWSVVGPAHMRRYMRLGAAADEWTRALRDLERTKLQSPAFVRFLERVTALRLRGVQAEVRRFRRGSDYTVATAAGVSAHGELDVTLCFVDGDADAWASGEVGGFDLYLEREPDETGDVAAVYSRDQDGEGLVSIDAAFGTLSIVLRDAARMHFVKYVAHGAPSDRYDVAAVFECAEEEEAE